MRLDFRWTRRLLLGGVSMLLVATLLDALAHLTGAVSWQTPTHLAALTGMVATLTAVVIKGLSQPRVTATKEVRNARR